MNLGSPLRAEMARMTSSSKPGGRVSASMSERSDYISRLSGISRIKRVDAEMDDARPLNRLRA